VLLEHEFVLELVLEALTGIGCLQVSLSLEY